MIRSVLRCVSKTQCHMQTALVAQLLEQPDYALVLKALEASSQHSCDATDVLYALIWDATVLEQLVHVLRRKNFVGLLDAALKCLASSDLNASNSADVRAICAHKR